MTPRDELRDTFANVCAMMPMGSYIAERIEQIAAHGSDEEVAQALSGMRKALEHFKAAEAAFDALLRSPEYAAWHAEAAARGVTLPAPIAQES